MLDFLIKGRYVITVDEERRILRDGAVGIVGDRIVAVDKAAKVEHEHPRARKVIDASNKVVMPGLIDCHTHFVEIARGYVPDVVRSREWVRDYIWPLMTVSTPEDEYWIALNMIAHKLRTGTTAFAECGCMFPDSSVRAAIEAGIRCAIGWYCWDQTGAWAKTAPPVLETEKILRRTQQLMDELHGSEEGRIRVFATSAGVGTASDNLWIGLKELADAYSTTFQTHCATSQELVEMRVSSTGHREVEHLEHIGVLDSNVLLAHTVAIDDNEVKLIADRDAKVSYNPGAALQQVKGVTQIGKFPEMLQAGVTVGVGIDSPDSGIGGDMVRSLQVAVGLLRDATMDPSIATSETAIELGTIQGARAIGLESDLGSLEPGKKADIIIFDTQRPEWVPIWNVVQNLVWSASGDSVETVMIDGRIVVDGGQVLTIDVPRVVNEVESRQPSVEDRLKGLVTFPSRWPVI